jgi:two-component sensor histidine kinase
VTDDGIGMPTGSDAPKAGLGTGIVEALVRNLHGEIQLSDADPGTAVTITHRGAPIANADLPPAA